MHVDSDFRLNQGNYLYCLNFGEEVAVNILISMATGLKINVGSDPYSNRGNFLCCLYFNAKVVAARVQVFL